MKKLFLPTDIRHQLSDICSNSYPQEACGLLLGCDDGEGSYSITSFVPSPNLSHHPEKSFEIDPSLIIHYQKESRSSGRQIIGHYHSHPDGKAEPSQRDQDQNYDPDLVWVIVEVRNKEVKAMNVFATDKSSGKLKAIPLNLTQPGGTA